MEKLEITLDSDITGYFRSLVGDVVRSSPRAPDPLVEQYLLGLLTDCALGDIRVHGAQDAPLGVQLAEALHAASAVRFERLRQLGDEVLLLGGLFEPHLGRAGLDDGYVARIGETAYGAASALMTSNAKPLIAAGPTASPDIMLELSVSFRSLMHLLRDVADTMLARAARSATDLCILIEKWLRTRSDHLGRLLSVHGVVLGGSV
jgi:hypothetical protein